MTYRRTNPGGLQYRKIIAWIDHYPMSTLLRNGLRRLMAQNEITTPQQIDKPLFLQVRGLGKRSWEEFQEVREGYEAFLPPEPEENNTLPWWL